MPAEYSGAPLLKKLGAKDGQTALLVAVPEEVDQLHQFSGWTRIKNAKTHRGISGGPYDYIHFFTNDIKALKSALPALKREVAQNGLIWVSWPKKSSGVATTVGDMDVRSGAIKIGLVDIKVCAVDDVWSGLKLVIPVKDRKK